MSVVQKKAEATIQKLVASLSSSQDHNPNDVNNVRGCNNYPDILIISITSIHIRRLFYTLSTTLILPFNFRYPKRTGFGQ